MFTIGLYQPEIPHNTGNISRLCVGLGCTLALVKPLGFSLEDKHLRRAGLDHWGDLQLSLYESLDELLATRRVAIFSKRGEKLWYEHRYQKGDLLLFGSETHGLPKEIIRAGRDHAYTLPILGPVRSMNLANSVAAVAYEGVRQLMAGGADLPPRVLFDLGDGAESFDVHSIG
jgi:tRNA (cytidine/uridine-2'-O-)-methyltransferase